jgi:DNA adenine methylase
MGRSFIIQFQKETTMKYVGGKYRYQKDIVPVIYDFIEDGQPYYEPFIGGGWITQNITDRPVYASDHDPDLILLYQAAQTQESMDFIPDSISESEYAVLRHENLEHDIHSPLHGFVKYVCSFGGKSWGGYARDIKRGTNLVEVGKRSLSKQMKRMRNVTFSCNDYRAISDVTSAIIYCDPPYAGCSPAYCRGFDNNAFWNWARFMSASNTVLVSEYTAPPDFECVLEIPTNLIILPRKEKGRERIERA